MMNWREINTRYIYPADNARKEGRPEEAERTLLEGLAATDNDGNIALHYARLLFDQERYHEAERYCSMASINCPWDEYRYEARVLKRKAQKMLNYSTGDDPEIELGLIMATRFKGEEAGKASDLYSVSPEFKRHLTQALEKYARVYILSPRYGLVEPDQIIKPYDFDLNEFQEYEKTAWAEFIAANLSLEYEYGGKLGMVSVHCSDDSWMYICRALGKKDILCRQEPWI